MSSVRADNWAVFVAFDVDLKILREASSEPPKVLRRGAYVMERLKIGQHVVVVAKTGSGVVLAAANAATLLASDRFDGALSIGAVGALDPTLAIGTWCFVQKVVPYQKGTLTGAGILEGRGFEEGTGSSSPALEQLAPAGEVGKSQPITVASGDAFVASSTAKEGLRRSTDAQAVDMNLWGLQVACERSGVPLWSWRFVSDLADDDASETFKRTARGYDGEGARRLLRLLRSLRLSPASPLAYPAIRKALEASSGAK